MKSKYLILRVFAAACFIAVFFSGCVKKVEIPAEDDTAPDIELEISGLGEKIILKPGDSKLNDTIMITVPPSNLVSVIASATDENGGIKKVWIEGVTYVECSQRNDGITYRTFNEFPGETGETVRATRIAGISFKVNDYKEKCAPDALIRAYGSFTAQAENFHNGKSAPLKFHFRTVETTQK